MVLSTPRSTPRTTIQRQAAAARTRVAARTVRVSALWVPWGSGTAAASGGARSLLSALTRRPVASSSTVVSTAEEAPPAAAIPVEQWTDRFTELRDRVAAPPLALPPIEQEQEVTLVRHGQSTWNAENRVQGSSDESVLTDKGIRQAQATRELLAPTEFTQLWFSPLARASQTAQVVWNGRVGPQHCDPVLREIDLYLFQGLLKHEVRERYAAEHQRWHHRPDEFELAGHLPVHETWYRASLAWQKLLLTSAPSSSPSPAGAGATGEAGTTSSGSSSSKHTLVVAHNNINQALIAVALQLPVSFFRRLVQNNAAVSRLHFTPADQPGQPPEAKLLCLNQSSANPFRRSSQGQGVAGRVVLVVGSEDERAQRACADVLAQTTVSHVLVLSEPGSSPGAASSSGCVATAAALAARCHSDQEGGEPDVMTLMQQAGNEAWQSVVRLAAERGGCTVAVVLSPQAAAGLTCSAFGLGQLARPKFHFDAGGISVFDFAAQPGTVPPTARCINNMAHLLAPSTTTTATSTIMTASSSSSDGDGNVASAEGGNVQQQ